MAKLVIFRGDSVESELHLRRQTIRIGRDARNDVVLDDKTVTRFHAEVGPDGDGYYIVDLNSRNGVWINNQRIRAKTPLTMGVPATVGAYEVTLEDDVSTSELDDFTASGTRTVVTTGATPAQQRSSASTSRARPAPKPGPIAKATATPAVFWPIVAVGTLTLCVVTYFAVRRFMTRPQSAPVVVAPPTPPSPTVDATTTTTPGVVTANVVAGYLEAAQIAIDDQDYEAARDDIEAALELDPSNQDLLAKQKQIADLIASPPTPVVKAVPKPPVPDVQETAGIPRRPNEAAADYTARVGRIQTNMREGQRNLEQEEFAAAIARYQAVQRDQPGYLNSESQLADAVARQKKQVDAAIENGQKNEQANNLLNAVRWYDRALRIDPNSAAAQQRLAAVADRRTKEGLDAFSRAEVLRKRNDIAKAIDAYQQAADLLPAANDKKAEAQQWLEKLKQ